MFFLVSLWAVKLPKNIRREIQKCWHYWCFTFSKPRYLLLCCDSQYAACSCCVFVICVCDCLSICYVINAGYPAMFLGEW